MVDKRRYGTGTRLQQQGTRGEVDIGRTWTTKATSLGVGKAPQRSNAVGNGCAIRDMIDPTSTRKTQRKKAGIKMRRGWVTINWKLLWLSCSTAYSNPRDDDGWAWSPDAQIPLCSARLIKRLNKPIGAAASRFSRPTSFDPKELKEPTAILRGDGVSKERCYGARR
ncbi:hypothetical protein BDP55DRAFT_627271 [Colletotrichum godetiae]|uniref:Uncharacterized protein n=1 Tax=Colletotrichum godetiae TaxID=1209918 RepID=A0AAJ0EZ19_9PEZI|nr:uncharacterized protein BDP55DRAFT_627271 [Colletotrichum godetiae]KAK1691645.1 hypothetical protein BDP55DRAFT_627271 [Colletotrichum godetiae]